MVIFVNNGGEAARWHGGDSDGVVRQLWRWGWWPYLKGDHEGECAVHKGGAVGYWGVFS